MMVYRSAQGGCLPVRYIEQAEDGVSNIEVTISREDAIRIQREAVARSHPEFNYSSDEQALEDFMTIHWAWLVQ